jgi:hypothetical protein
MTHWMTHWSCKSTLLAESNTTVNGMKPLLTTLQTTFLAMLKIPRCLIRGQPLYGHSNSRPDGPRPNKEVKNDVIISRVPYKGVISTTSDYNSLTGNQGSSLQLGYLITATGRPLDLIKHWALPADYLELMSYIVQAGIVNG